MAVSFIGGGNRSSRRKSPTCQKLLTNFITLCCIEYTSPWTRFELTILVVIDTDVHVVVNPTTIPSRPRRSPVVLRYMSSSMHVVSTIYAVAIINYWLHCNMMVRMSKYIIIERQFFPEPDLLYIKQTQIILYIICFLICQCFLVQTNIIRFFLLSSFTSKATNMWCTWYISTFGDGQNVQ